MLTLLHPGVLLLLPLPLLVARWLTPHHEVQSSVRLPSLDRMIRLTGQQPSAGAVVLRRSWWQHAFLFAAWCCALLAAARPQFIGEPITKTMPSRDLLLAVDLSGSMETEDFTDSEGNQVDRLTAVKQVLDDFLSRREGDRVGLIFFGSAAFVQAPFTEDLDLCRTLLDEAQVRMAGPQTVVGDAVGLALTVFERSEQADRVLILLTDGNDTGSKVPPDRAADIARDQDVTIYTVAVGDPSSVGEEKIDEEVLQAMAEKTGGGFFQANNRDELAGIYQRLDALDTRDLESQSYRPKTDLFHWPLGLFLILGLGFHGMQAFGTWIGSRRVPSPGGLAAAAWACMLIAAAPTGELLTQFHFLRPAWLLGLVPAAAILWAIARRQDARQAWRGVIHERLLRHLLVQPKAAARFRPIHLLAIIWGLSVFALGGPTWRREPSPFTDDEAAIVFALEVSPTMLAQDIQPSRLERAVHKIRDLLSLRPGTNAALIAYAGSAHLVMPITSDAEIIASFAAELTPDVMPEDGDVASEALRLANRQLESKQRPGSIVLMTDGIDASQNELLRQVQGAPVHVLAIAGDQSKPLPLGSPPAPAIDEEALRASADAAQATLTLVQPDESDVQRLSRNIRTNFVAAREADGRQRWLDSGYWLSPCIALLTLVWFRPGWVIRWE